MALAHYLLHIFQNLLQKQHHSRKGDQVKTNAIFEHLQSTFQISNNDNKIL